MSEDWLAVIVRLEPVAVYAIATFANTAVALGAAWALFGH
jgi:hypothetical protein